MRMMLRRKGTLQPQTSNASPDYYGAERAGDNLFTASILALDATTGEYEWHYQQVHHDIWDLDSPSPTVLVEGEMEGEMREGIAQPSKTGWLYVLDRKTGKPIFPIEEKPVPQDPKEKTSATQPYPSLPPFSWATKTMPSASATPRLSQPQQMTLPSGSAGRFGLYSQRISPLPASRAKTSSAPSVM